MDIQETGNLLGINSRQARFLRMEWHDICTHILAHSPASVMWPREEHGLDLVTVVTSRAAQRTGCCYFVPADQPGSTDCKLCYSKQCVFCLPSIFLELEALF